MQMIFDEYSQLTSADEQNQFLSDLLRFAAEKVVERKVERCEDDSLKEELQRTQEELHRANSRIENAKEYVRELKSDAESADKRIRKELYKNLQTVRDRIIAILEIAISAGDRIEGNSRAKVSLTELNNIIAAADSIIREMKALDLWTDADESPEVKTFREKTPAKKKSPSAEAKSKKQPPVVEEQIALTME